jgi:hypothetical protein
VDRGIRFLLGVALFGGGKVIGASGTRQGGGPALPDPPIGTVHDSQRRTTTVSIPPGALLCCFTDGLVERRGDSIDRGIGKLATILDELITAGTRHRGIRRPNRRHAFRCLATEGALPTGSGRRSHRRSRED